MLNAIEVILLCLITQAAVTDLAVRKIPNVLVLSGLALALLLHLARQSGREGQLFAQLGGAGQWRGLAAGWRGDQVQIGAAARPSG